MTHNTLTRQRLQQLTEESAALYEWTVVSDFAVQMYGEGKAVRVEIETYEHYDDENYSYPLGNIAAYDKDGVELSYDHRLPFFATKAWRAEARYDHGNDFDVFKEMTMSGKEKQQGNWILCDDLPHPDDEECTTTYDLTRTPCLSQVTLLPQKDEESDDNGNDLDTPAATEARGGGDGAR